MLEFTTENDQSESRIQACHVRMPLCPVLACLETPFGEVKQGVYRLVL